MSAPTPPIKKPETGVIHWLSDELWPFIEQHVLSIDMLIQGGILVAAVILSTLVSKQPRRWIDTFIARHPKVHWFKPPLRAIEMVLRPVCMLILLLVGFAAMALLEDTSRSVLVIAVNLTVAWILIRFLTYFMNKPVLAKWFAVIVWVVVALNIVGVLPVITNQMEAVGFDVGDSRVSVLSLFKSIITFTLFLWGAMFVARIIENKVRSIRDLTPSVQVLISKITRITLISLAFVIGLKSFGIDLTALAVFSGAIGVGVGFGLQKVVSNFISGIILLLDRSIKPGDVIVIDQTYGWVNSLGARNVSVITRDGKEHLIPNELLITEKVENWSYSNDDIRIRVPIGIAYHSDVPKAIELVKEAAKECPRVLEKYDPVCLLDSFGDSSVNLELRVWMNDPANGIGNVKSDILLRVWQKFHEHDVEIPFPQRDLHIRDPKALAQAFGFGPAKLSK